MKNITRNPNTGKIEIQSMNYVMDIDEDEEKELSKLLCRGKDGKRN